MESNLFNSIFGTKALENKVNKIIFQNFFKDYLIHENRKKPSWNSNQEPMGANEFNEFLLLSFFNSNLVIEINTTVLEIKKIYIKKYNLIITFKY